MKKIRQFIDLWSNILKIQKLTLSNEVLYILDELVYLLRLVYKYQSKAKSSIIRNEIIKRFRIFWDIFSIIFCIEERWNAKGWWNNQTDRGSHIEPIQIVHKLGLIHAQNIQIFF